MNEYYLGPWLNELSSWVSGRVECWPSRKSAPLNGRRLNGAIVCCQSKLIFSFLKARKNHVPNSSAPAGENVKRGKRKDAHKSYDRSA